MSILFFYVIYSLYILIVINITDLSLIYMVPSLLLLWFNYFSFFIGTINYRKRNFNTAISSKNKPMLYFNNKILFLIAIISILFSILATWYYTGQTPISLIESVLTGQSLYYEYQLHFSQVGLSNFNVYKIPFIIMLFFIKLVLFFSYISFFLFKKKLKIYDYLYLLLITFSQIYFTIARGTNIEFFEITVLVIFILINRSTTLKALFKKTVNISLLISIMIMIYFISVSSRGVSFTLSFTPDVSYEPLNFFSNYFPFITRIASGLFGYFGFGFFYTAVFINEIWSQSFVNFIAGILPKGYNIIFQEDIASLIDSIIDIGVRWHPDTVNIINDIGYIGLLLLCFILGFFTKIIKNKHYKNEFDYLLLFLIMLQMISLPVGNFIFSSSSNQLIVFTLSIYYFWTVFIRKKIVLK